VRAWPANFVSDSDAKISSALAATRGQAAASRKIDNFGRTYSAVRQIAAMRIKSGEAFADRQALLQMLFGCRGADYRVALAFPVRLTAPSVYQVCTGQPS